MAPKKRVSAGVKRDEKPQTQYPSPWKKGRKWSYLTTAPSQLLLDTCKLEALDYRYLLIVTIVSLVSKLLHIGSPHVVVFDESHIVSHINKYIDGVYFNDVSPPLAGLFYTFIAYLAGYRGDAPITKPGEDYLMTYFPYKVLRATSAVIGTAVSLMSYLTLRSCGVRSHAAFTASLVFVFESMATMTGRLFLPDSLFLFGVALAVMSYKKFDISQPFGRQWIKYLLLTGVALGLTVSTKWIGLATVGWILSLSAIKLWFILGDLDVNDRHVTYHSIARLGSFVFVPFAIYFGVIAVHTMLLNQFHNDASLLSTAYQRELAGNDVWSIPKYVTWNSTITLRHTDSIGGYLHSHPYNYKSGSKQQQVTVFKFKDFHNEWIVEQAPGGRYDADEPRVKNDQKVVLRHKNTGAVLRVDNFKAPISEQDYEHEVSCFGNSSSVANETDVFHVKLEDERNKNLFLTATDVKFRLYNPKKRCTVLSHDITLPEWAFNQQEVICIDPPNLARSYFKIETVKHPKNLDYEKYPMLAEKLPYEEVPMWKKFVEVNHLIYKLLIGIKSTNKNASNGYDWLWLQEGLRFSSRKDSTLYVIGNPVTFMLPLVLIPVFAIIAFVSFMRGDYGAYTYNYNIQAASFAAGYLFHWFPYFMLEGEYFLQYYLPALYFAVLLAGVTLEYVMVKNSNVGYVIMGLMVFLSLHYFGAVLPVTWGTPWTKAGCEAARLFPGWDFRCDMYN